MTNHSIIRSGELAVSTVVIVIEVPLLHVPVSTESALVSFVGALVENDCEVVVSAVPVLVARFSHFPKQDPSVVLPR